MLDALVQAAEFVDLVLLRPLTSVIDVVIAVVYYFLWISYFVGFCLVEGSRQGWNLLSSTVRTINEGIRDLAPITLDVANSFCDGIKGGLQKALDFGHWFICNLLIDLGDGILWLLMLLPRAILFLWDCLLGFVVHSIVAHGLSLLNSAFRASIGLALLLILYMFRRYVYLLLIYLRQRARTEISTKTQSVYLWIHYKLQHFMHNFWYASEKAGSASPERCVVCMTQSRNVVVMPCRHLCLCKECSMQLTLLLEDRCPVCRHNITSFLSVYV
ncbi:uncharacterized protein LOC117143183 [Drosophila mauritiana]|uniref:Uncharacterized protein LOC117143183 n=1 Tax=Drosophila mauritiana TaxID=7226 RepID=A0A6P8KJN5_DROMA|nr:uncharacterized protein LOC117143183 [Drosophila mauritiana]